MSTTLLRTTLAMIIAGLIAGLIAGGVGSIISADGPGESSDAELGSSLSQGDHSRSATGTTAIQNLSLDPWGRVIDVTFDHDVDLIAPLERYKFGIDIVQPLARDSGAFLGDLTDDGILDLLLATFNGETLFFPGIADSPRRFGDGFYLHQVTDASSTDPFKFESAEWITGDIGDLNGDGNKEIVIGGMFSATLERRTYPNCGTYSHSPSNPDGTPAQRWATSMAMGNRISWSSTITPTAPGYCGTSPRRNPSYLPRNCFIRSHRTVRGTIT